MCDGSRFTIVRVIAIEFFIHARLLRPHRTHGDIIELLHLHAIRDQRTAALMRLAIVAKSSFLQRCLYLAVMLIGG